MDKNTLWGLVLIGVVILGFSYFNQPSPEQQKAAIEQAQRIAKEQAEQAAKDSLATVPASAIKPDSLQESAAYQRYGVLANASQGESKVLSLKNDLLSLKFDTKGGMPIEAQLLKYKAQDNKPLYYFTPKDISLNLPLLTADNRAVGTDELYFQPINQTDSTLTMRLNVDSATYLDIAYLLPRNDYRLRMSISGKNLSALFPANMTMQEIEWSQKLRRQEKSWKFENQYSTIYYKAKGGDVDKLSETKQAVSEDVKSPLRWFAMKDKYFSAVLIGINTSFEDNKFETKTMKQDGEYTKDCKAVGRFSFNIRQNTKADFVLFIGPNDYELLKGYDKLAKENYNEELQLEKLVYLGASVFRWINAYMIIPTVEFLNGFISNWGIIILILTVLIKLILSPLTYKSYLSQAKMRVLKPQVEAINAKYPGKDQDSMLKRNQETMALYKAAGANPMSGCLPMLFQMPFLIAMYMYFPTSVLLRGQSFLWAKDLSTYDPIISWSYDIPVVNWIFGDHISLFCLLWAVTNIIYSHYTMSQSSTGQQQMPGMKWMPYIMTIMFLVFFNSNSSGLCYYYFLSTLITIIQYIAFRFAINEEKLLKKMEENKKKPQKKSKWVQRMEELQKQQREMQRQQNRRR